MSAASISVLLVEDELAYADALKVSLGREGYDVRTARSGPDALDQFAKANPDIVLLDLMLPGLSGADVCREIRKSSNVPIIMVTAKGSEVDKVIGLEIGADDYITKPYSLQELTARMRAVLRRTRPGLLTSDSIVDDVIEVGPVELDLDRHGVKIRGVEVPLPLKEFELLEALVTNAGRAMSRASLMHQVWGFDFVGESKTLDVHIQRLRSRIEIDPSAPKVITTIRGVGYRFETNSEGNG